MAKPGVPKGTVAGGSKASTIPPLTSPIKRPRTEITKSRMIRPTALRKIVDTKSRSLAALMETNLTLENETLSTSRSVQPQNDTPTNPPALSNPPTNPQTTIRPPTNPQTNKQPPTNPQTNNQPPSNPQLTVTKGRRPTKQQKSLARQFLLRRSPRKHLTSTNHTRKNPASKVVEPPTNDTTDYVSTDDGLHTSDMDMNTSQRERVSLSLVDEEEDSSDSGVAVPDRFHDAAEDVETDGLLNGEAVDGGMEGGEEGMEDVEQYTSSDDEEVAEGEAENEERVTTENSTGKKARRTRGPTRCLKLVGVKKRNRVTVILNNFNQPIGPVPQIQQFGSSIGILAKNHLVVSLEHKSWREVPEPVKDEIWRLIKRSWKIPSRGKDWVLKTCGASWRSYKSRLKAKYFEEGLTEDQLLERRPLKLVPADQWKKLVEYWLDEKTQELSKRNRESVKQRKNVHTAGSCSFARITAAEAKDGKEASLATVFIKTHTSKKGVVIIDEQTKADLQELGDDKEVEEYLLQKNLIKKRPGAVALKGRGVTYRDMKKANFEQKVHKKAEEKVDLVRAECNFKINELKGQFTSVITTVINNFLGRLQTTNLQPHFAGFNPFHGCPSLDNSDSEDSTYVPNESYSDDDDSSSGSASSGSGDDNTHDDSGEDDESYDDSEGEEV